MLGELNNQKTSPDHLRMLLSQNPFHTGMELFYSFVNHPVTCYYIKIPA